MSQQPWQIQQLTGLNEMDFLNAPTVDSAEQGVTIAVQLLIEEHVLEREGAAFADDPQGLADHVSFIRRVSDLVKHKMTDRGVKGPLCERQVGCACLLKVGTLRDVHGGCILLTHLL